MVEAYASVGCMLSAAHRLGYPEMGVALDYVGRMPEAPTHDTIGASPGPVAPPCEWMTRFGVGGDMDDKMWAQTWNEAFWFQERWHQFYCQVNQPAPAI